MSQQQIILDILKDDKWHCSSEFYAQYMADPRKRLHELKTKGYELENRTCELHNYHLGGSKMWRLIQPNNAILPTFKQPLTLKPAPQPKLFTLQPAFRDV